MMYTGRTALVYSGLIQASDRVKDVATSNKNLDWCRAGRTRYIFNQTLDDNTYTKLVDNGVHTPIPERALIEWIINDHIIDEGTFIWAMQNYLNSSDKNLPLLYEVANHFGVSRETVDYWIKEAEEEDDMSMG